MAEWLFEEGIGESRAALVQGGEIVEAAIELPSRLRAGAVLPARLARILIPGRRGIADLGESGEALLEPVPPGLAEGARFHAEVVREEVPDPARAKLPKVRATELEPRPGPVLAERIAARPAPSFGPDGLEEAGWSELMEQALSGRIPFPGGELVISLTPAMILVDVDGHLPPDELAVAGAAAAARAIRRFAIGGSIGIDLPTMPDKAARQAAAAAFDWHLPQPFERTAVNGFGFLQIVRRRERPSIPETVQTDPAAAGARLLLRRAERWTGHGERTLHGAPAVIARLEREQEWLEELDRRVSARCGLRAEAGLAILAGYVHHRIL